MEEKILVEPGQIYVAKDGVPQSTGHLKTLKIMAEFKDPECPQLVNMWEVMFMNGNGEWETDPNHDLLFIDMLETNYNLHFKPMQNKRSRLEDLED